MADRDLLSALDLLATGDWKAAHNIVQEDDSTLAAWLHGIVHTLEGDLDSALLVWQGRSRLPRARSGAGGDRGRPPRSSRH